MYINVQIISLAREVNMSKVKATTRLDMFYVYNGPNTEEHFTSKTS